MRLSTNFFAQQNGNPARRNSDFSLDLEGCGAKLNAKIGSPALKQSFTHRGFGGG